MNKLFYFLFFLVLWGCTENKNAPYKDNTEVPSKVMRGADADTVDTGNVAPQEP